MQKCEKCGYIFNYFQMFKATRNVHCKKCNTAYKVEAKHIVVFFLMLALCTLSFNFLSDALPSAYNWQSISIILLAFYMLAPFNQRLEEIKEQANKAVKRDK